MRERTRTRRAEDDKTDEYEEQREWEKWERTARKEGESKSEHDTADDRKGEQEE